MSEEQNAIQQVLQLWTQFLANFGTNFALSSNCSIMGVVFSKCLITALATYLTEAVYDYQHAFSCSRPLSSSVFLGGSFQRDFWPTDQKKIENDQFTK